MIFGSSSFSETPFSASPTQTTEIIPTSDSVVVFPLNNKTLTFVMAINTQLDFSGVMNTVIDVSGKINKEAQFNMVR